MSGQDNVYKLVTEALGNYLTKSEMRIYLLLLRYEGGLRATDISKTLKLYRTEIYKICGRLEKKGILLKTFSRPMKIIANPFPEVVEHLIEVDKINASQLRKCAELVGGFVIDSETVKPEIFYSSLEGRVIYTTANRLAERTEKVRVSGPNENILKLSYMNFFDHLKGECELLLPEPVFPALEEYLNDRVNVRVASDGIAQYFIVADDEVIIFVDTENYNNNTTAWNLAMHKAFRTNEKDIIKAYNTLFKLLYTE